MARPFDHNPLAVIAKRHRVSAVDIGSTGRKITGKGVMAKKLGKYTVLGEIGRGGMAVVYRAHQESLDRIVAIKELDLSKTSQDPKALERFQLEARSAASLDHPSIVTVHDFWERSRNAYIAMEFVDGLEVKEALDEVGSINPATAAYTVLQVARALAYAHERGIIHRDIKPGNIMLSARGQVKLADFGIALVSGSADLTTTGQVIGTPAYMSPEQIKDDTIGPSSDIFSLGVVLYEMLTGVKPFIAPTDAAVIHAIIHKRPASPRRLNKRVPRRLSRLVMKALRKKPRRRYGNMDELVTALQRALPGKESYGQSGVTALVVHARGSVGTDETMPLTDLKQSVSRKPAYGLLLAAVLAMIIVLLLWAGDTNRLLQNPALKKLIAAAPAVTVPLKVNAYPWAEVILDGKHMGYTPSARPFMIPAGNHTLVLKNTYMGTKTIHLDLKEGDSPAVSVDFLEEK